MFLVALHEGCAVPKVCLVTQIGNQGCSCFNFRRRAPEGSKRTDDAQPSTTRESAKESLRRQLIQLYEPSPSLQQNYYSLQFPSPRPSPRPSTPASGVIFRRTDGCSSSYNLQNPSGTVQVPLKPLHRPACFEPSPSTHRSADWSGVCSPTHHSAQTTFTPMYSTHSNVRQQVVPQWKVRPQQGLQRQSCRVLRVIPKSPSTETSTIASTRRDDGSSQARRHQQAAAIQLSDLDSHKHDNRCVMCSHLLPLLD